MHKEQHLLLLGLNAVLEQPSAVIKQVCLSLKTRLTEKNDFSTELITGEYKAGFISRMMDSLKEAEGVGTGARFSKQTTTTCTISQGRRLDSNYRLRAALLGSLHNLHGSQPRQCYNPV